tara:strand:- start:630 stop:1523 length:894 start_codon:yes stop_codon:yes gene_type:complete
MNLYKAILLLTGIIISVIILILHQNFYVKYFFPELNDLRNDKSFILTNTQNKQDLFLIKGMLPLNNTEILFNTGNKNSTNYIKMSKSINNPSGSEMTYSFWLNKKSASVSDYSNKVILLKGLKNSNTKCPLIRFGDESNKMFIEFNTSSGTEEICIGENCLPPTQLGITDGDKWFLITVVLKDFRNPDNNFEEGINVLVYLNGSLVNSGTVIKGQTLKTNNSPLYILPHMNDADYRSLSGTICDMKYFNYALDQIEIKNIYNNNLNQHPFKTALDLKIQNSTNTSRQKYDLQLLNEL